MRHGQSRARVPRDGGGVIIEDPLLNRPARPCANCRAVFRPTVRRRMLCHDCFVYAPEDDPTTYPLRLTSSPR